MRSPVQSRPCKEKRTGNCGRRNVNIRQIEAPSLGNYLGRGTSPTRPPNSRVLKRKEKERRNKDSREALASKLLNIAAN